MGSLKEETIKHIKAGVVDYFADFPAYLHIS